MPPEGSAEASAQALRAASRPIYAERLPAYAPELNPTEQVWGNVKSTELANLCADSIGEVAAIAERGLDRISSDATLCSGFLRHAGLHL